MPKLPQIDSAQFKTEADALLPIIEKVAVLIPGVGQEASQLASLIQGALDNDNFRNAVVALYNDTFAG